jgi:uncharacterized membrane protein (DUF373 family)
MTCMPSPEDHQEQAGRAEPPGGASAVRPRRGAQGWLVLQEDGRWISLLEHAQSVVTLAVGVILLVLAAILLVAGVVDFAHASRPVELAAQTLLDQILLVLILVEVVHTVVITLRAHRLVAQPFIVIGLIAVIRRILLVLTPVDGTHSELGTSQLALLIAMVAVFVASLIAVGMFERQRGLPAAAPSPAYWAGADHGQGGAVTLVSGATSRTKVVDVAGADPAVLDQLLAG